MSMNLFVAGLSYKTAPVEVREKLAIQPARLSCYGCQLKLTGGLSEVVVVSTCNRVEIYGVGGRVLNEAALFETLSRSDFDFSEFTYLKRGQAAAEHLFSVAAGLDSMVIGETEITGQMKQAYETAQKARLTGKITNRLFQTALQVAKEIRTQTAIGRGSTSVGSVAVDLADKIFDGDLTDKRVLIIGAGKMGEACVRHLAKKGTPSISVVNRSLEKAMTLAKEFGGRAVALENLTMAVVESDIIVSSTGSPSTILTRKDFEAIMPQRRNKPLFLIDIAVPRDIDSDAQLVPNVYLYNVDHLESIVRENVQVREKELTRCQNIVQNRAEGLMARFTPSPTPQAATRPVLAPEFSLG